MQAAETPAERQARQFAQLRTLGDLAMTIAQAAGNAAAANPGEAGASAQAATIFMRAASTVRQIIALELRLEAGPAKSAAAAHDLRPAPPPDPRRPILRQVLHDAVRNHADRARRRTVIDKHIDQELLADPDDVEPISEILAVISRNLDIDIDPARLTDAFLDYNEPIKLADFRNRSRDPSS